MTGDKPALENCQGTDRVHLVAILQNGRAEDVASRVLVDEDDICQRGVFCSSVSPFESTRERFEEHIEPAFATVVVLAKRGAQLFQHCARGILVLEVLGGLIVNNVPHVFAAAALMPGASPLTVDKIGMPLALSLDPTRREIHKLGFWPVVPVERTIRRRRNELDCRVVDCNLDSGCIVEGNEQGHKKHAQERVLHITTPWDLGLRATGRALRDSSSYEAKMS